MERVREVKVSFCILSVAYIVLGLLLLFWPDISVRTFCYVFGVSMIVFGGANLILYFVKDKGLSVMQQELVIGVICLATGCNVLMKLEYMLELIPFVLGVVSLLGGIIKIQHGLDLKRLYSSKWYFMLIWAGVLLVLGIVLVINPFDEQQKLVVFLVGISLLLDGIGNLTAIIWTGIIFKKSRVSRRTFTDGRGFPRKEKRPEMVEAEVLSPEEKQEEFQMEEMEEETSEEEKDLPAEVKTEE